VQLLLFNIGSLSIIEQSPLEAHTSHTAGAVGTYARDVDVGEDHTCTGAQRDNYWYQRATDWRRRHVRICPDAHIRLATTDWIHRSLCGGQRQHVMYRSVTPAWS